MDTFVDFLIQLLTMKISWFLPDGMELELWLWGTIFSVTLGSIALFIKLAVNLFKKVFD